MQLAKPQDKARALALQSFSDQFVIRAVLNNRKIKRGNTQVSSFQGYNAEQGSAYTPAGLLRAVGPANSYSSAGLVQYANGSALPIRS